MIFWEFLIFKKIVTIDFMNSEIWEIPIPKIPGFWTFLIPYSDFSISSEYSEFRNLKSIPEHPCYPPSFFAMPIQSIDNRWKEAQYARMCIGEMNGVDGWQWLELPKYTWTWVWVPKFTWVYWPLGYWVGSWVLYLGYLGRNKIFLAQILLY
jgi:hypothetical protein